jgi:hypothetical protein
LTLKSNFYNSDFVEISSSPEANLTGKDNQCAS